MLFNSDTKSESIHLRVTNLQKNNLKKLAEEEGLTLTNFIFKCINFYLEQNQK